MSGDLITSLRALAAARHDDLSVAVDAVIEIERLRAENKSAKADAWDEGYQDHADMIDGIARKPSNPYR